MPVPSDVIVARTPFPNVQEVPLSGILKIGIVCKTRGAVTSAGLEITRSATDEDVMPTDMLNPVRSINYAQSNETGFTQEKFYPNKHFLVKYDGTTVEHPELLGDNSDPTKITLDWSIAPALQPPPIVSATISTYTGAAGFTSTDPFKYAIIVLDHNGDTTTLGPLVTVVPTGATALAKKQITLTWRAVEYAASYDVYREATTGSGVLLKLASIASPATVTYVDDNTTTPTGAAPATNTSHAEPGEADKYQLYYSYAVFEYNIPHTYTTVEQVIAAHGIGSEAHNLARGMLLKEYNNAPALVIVAVEDTSETAYIAGLIALGGTDVQFVGCMYGGIGSAYTDFAKYVYQHAASNSDSEDGQKERFAILAQPVKAGVSMYTIQDTIAALQATATKGKHGVFIMPDGVVVTIDSWVKEDGTVETAKTVTDAASNDISSQVAAFFTLARYTGIRDSAEPLTEKDVLGFSFVNPPMSSTELQFARDWGALVVENRNGVAVVSRGCTMAWPVLSLEDGDLSVVVTELCDLVPDIRRRIRKFRGTKMLGQNLRAIERAIRTALAQKKLDGKIAAYDEGSIYARQDSTQRNRVLGGFLYMPVYGIDQIKVLFDYIFVVL